MFFNKKDLFDEKIKKIQLSNAFPNYKGKQDADEAISFIQDQFKSLNQFPHEKGIYPMITTATDTDSMRPIIQAVHSVILEKAVERRREFK